MRKIGILLVCAAASWGGVFGQSLTETGRVVIAPGYDAGLNMALSQTGQVYGTARVAAMGGAFASLGADLSAMGINPAGLGMYHQSDWNFSTTLASSGMTTGTNYGGAFAADGRRTSFGLGNVGAAWNVHEGSGTLTSLTLGLNYTRNANFNSRTRIDTGGEDASITEMWARQLNWNKGVPENDLKPSSNPFSMINLPLFGAALGYQSGMVGLNSGGSWAADQTITPGTGYFGSVTRGGAFSFDWSAGANFSNILYVGATLGMANIDYKEETSYEEAYSTGDFATDMWFDQNSNISGSGYNVKLGVIVRPVESLRVGLAFHTPTYYTLNKRYSGKMGAGNSHASTGEINIGQEKFRSAPKLLAGLSATVGGRAIVALDWELAWHDRMRLRGLSALEQQASLTSSRDTYRPGHTLRAGVEFLANDVVSLRAGGSVMDDILRNGKTFVASNPFVRSGWNVTAGAGFKLGRNGYLDLAYVYSHQRYSDYELFYFQDDNGWAGQAGAGSGVDATPRTYTPTLKRHMLTLTLGSRF